MKVGCPIRIWMKDICEWSLLGSYDKVKKLQRIERDGNS